LSFAVELFALASFAFEFLQFRQRGQMFLIIGFDEPDFFRRLARPVALGFLLTADDFRRVEFGLQAVAFGF
jgi:hypothetical protein